MGMVTLENLEAVFTYQAPTPDQVAAYKAINDASKNLVSAILTHCPPSADASAAIREVRSARMTANASIALKGLI